MVAYIKHIAICSLIILSSFASAQTNKFYGTLGRKTISVGQKIQVEYKFEGGKPSGFTAPNVSELRMFGPISQGWHTSIINGNFTKAFSFTVTYQALKEGDIIIPPAKVQLKDEVFESNSLKLKVASKTNAENDIERQIAENLFIKAHVSKTKLYMGEQVKVTYKMYKRVNLSHLAHNKQPSYEGFWKETIASPEDFKLEPEVIDGVQYETGILESVILFPQKTGEIIIDPYMLDTRVPIRNRRSRDPFFDDFFGGYQQKDYLLKSPAVKLTVLPLPTQGKPSDFSGLIGEFDFSASLTATEIEKDDAVTLNIEVKGTGNLKLLKPWTVDLPNGIEDYPVKTHDKFSRRSGKFSGSRKYEYYMIPRREGLYKFPPIVFSYFDLKTEQYVTKKVDDLQIQVGKGGAEMSAVGTPAINAPMSVGKDDVNYLAQDILFIHTGGTHLSEIGAYYFGSGMHIFWTIVPFILLILVWLWNRRRQEENKDVRGLQRKRANALAIKRLKLAKTFLDNGNDANFYTELSRALFGFLGDKLGISHAEMSKERATTELRNNNIGEVEIAQMNAIIDQCEQARFAPISGDNVQSNLYQSSADIISKIETSVK